MEPWAAARDPRAADESRLNLVDALGTSARGSVRHQALPLEPRSLTAHELAVARGGIVRIGALQSIQYKVYSIKDRADRSSLSGRLIVDGRGRLGCFRACAHASRNSRGVVNWPVAMLCSPQARAVRLSDKPRNHMCSTTYHCSHRSRSRPTVPRSESVTSGRRLMRCVRPSRAVPLTFGANSYMWPRAAPPPSRVSLLVQYEAVVSAQANV